MGGEESVYSICLHPCFLGFYVGFKDVDGKELKYLKNHYYF